MISSKSVAKLGSIVEAPNERSEVGNLNSKRP